MLPVLCLALGAYWGPGFEDLSLVDLDGDSDLDLIGLRTGSRITWYENMDGLGSFGPPRDVDHPSAGTLPGPLATGDLDGDCLLHTSPSPRD